MPNTKITALNELTTTPASDDVLAIVDISSNETKKIKVSTLGTGGSGTVTNVATGTGLTGGPITTTGTISIATNGVTNTQLADLAVGQSNIQDEAVGNDALEDGAVTSSKLANTAVTAGSYTSANITVDAQGRLTAAANGAAGGVTSVTGTSPIVSSGGSTPAISIAQASNSTAGSMSAADFIKLGTITTAYEETEVNTGQNIIMNSSVSVTSDKIVDIMGDALADTSNANSKKLIGFHTGSGVCVLQGMVDAVNAINGATAGGPLWIGASGVFSSAAPTTTNYYSRVVGYFVGTGQGGEVICYFDPSKDWVQIS